MLFVSTAGVALRTQNIAAAMHQYAHIVPCLLSGASTQAGHVADGPGDNWFGQEQFSPCMVIVFVACMSPQPSQPHLTF